MPVNLYELLELTNEATDAQLKQAYRKLVLRYHPDKNPGNNTTVILFKQVDTAYKFLIDAQKRLLFDRGQIIFELNEYSVLIELSLDCRVDIFAQNGPPDFSAASDYQPQEQLYSRLAPRGEGCFFPGELLTKHRISKLGFFFSNHLCFSLLASILDTNNFAASELQSRFHRAVKATIRPFYQGELNRELYLHFIDRYLPEITSLFDCMDGTVEEMDLSQQMFLLLHYLTSVSEEIRPVERLFRVNLLASLLDLRVNEANYNSKLDELRDCWLNYFEQENNSELEYEQESYCF